jgi:hypothetical protein
MGQCTRDLDNQAIMQTIDQVTDVVTNIAQVQPLTAAISGKEDFPHVLQGDDHFLVARQWTVIQVVDSPH